MARRKMRQEHRKSGHGGLLATPAQAAAAFMPHACLAVASRRNSLLKLGPCRFPETSDMADQTLDTKGLACPLPILKVKKVLAGMPKGATLEVFATDPGSVPDFQAFSEATGNALLEQS